MGGWIKIFSKFLQWEWFDKAEMVQLFIYLLLCANYKDLYWRGIPVKRGQLLTSRDKISKDTGLTERQIRTCLSRLKTTGEIAVKTTNKYSIITICKYEEYQDDLQSARPTERPAECQSNDRQATSKATDKATTSTEDKNIRNKEISISEDIDTKKSRKAASPSASDEAQAEEPAEKIPFAEIKNLWNSTCTGFARLVVISDNRRNKIRNRVAEMGGVEKALPIIKTIFEKAQASSFLKGDNKRGWKASFDWFFENDKNWVKVFEGNYDEKPAGTPQARQYKPKDDVNDLWK